MQTTLPMHGPAVCQADITKNNEINSCMKVDNALADTDDKTICATHKPLQYHTIYNFAFAHSFEIGPAIAS